VAFRQEHIITGGGCTCFDFVEFAFEVDKRIRYKDAINVIRALVSDRYDRIINFAVERFSTRVIRRRRMELVRGKVDAHRATWTCCMNDGFSFSKERPLLRVSSD